MTCRIATILCATLLLAACSRSDEQPAPKLFNDQRNVLDQAKAVDAAQQKQAEEQRRTIEHETQ